MFIQWNYDYPVLVVNRLTGSKIIPLTSNQAYWIEKSRYTVDGVLDFEKKCKKFKEKHNAKEKQK